MAAEPYQFGGRSQTIEGGFVCQTAEGWIASIDLPREPGEPRRRATRRATDRADAEVLLASLRHELLTTGTIERVRRSAADVYTRRRVDAGWQVGFPGGWLSYSCRDLDDVPADVRGYVAAAITLVDLLLQQVDAAVTDLATKG